MPLLSDILAFVDSRKRVAQRNLSDLISNPREALEKTLYNAAQTIPEYMNDPMNFVGGGIGTFAGKGAKTANLAKQQTAETLLKAGEDPAKVWQETGWGLGPDGKWRFEIDDSASRYIDNKAATEFMSGPGPAEYFVGAVSNVLDHNSLAKAYPDALAIKARLKKGESGSYIPNTGFGEGLDLPSSGTHSTTLHELQHAIQQREGFARGGSPGAFTDYRGALEKAKASGGFDPVTGDADFVIEQQIKQFGADPMDAYRRLTGEAEARLTQSRMNMDAAQRASQYPWEPGYFEQATGVPLSRLISRFE